MTELYPPKLEVTNIAFWTNGSRKLAHHPQKVANYLQILEWLVNLPPHFRNTDDVDKPLVSEAGYFWRRGGTVLGGGTHKDLPGTDPVLNCSQVVDKDLKELKESWYSPRTKTRGF